MPRYLFHVRGGPIEADDAEGLDLPNEEAARQKAAEFARDLLAAAVLEGRLALTERIVICDAEGREVAALSFGQSVGLPD